MNTQDKNVGNLGDIYKHAALLQFAKLVFKNNDSKRATYIDSHCYLSHAKLANPRWSAHVRRLFRLSPMYRDYYFAERRQTRTQKYLTSSGLVCDNFNFDKVLLAEKQTKTRKRLRQQMLRRRTNLCHEIEIHADQFTLVQKIRKIKTPILVLHDPFKLEQACWHRLCTNLTRSTGIILVFAYNKSQTRVFWPAPPRNWLGPLAVYACSPFFLSCYASVAYANDVQKLCVNLGWYRRKLQLS